MIDSEEKDGGLWVFFGPDPRPVAVRLGVVTVATATVAALVHPLCFFGGIIVAAVVYSGCSQSALYFDRRGLRGVRRVVGQSDKAWALIATTTQGWVKREKLVQVALVDIVDVRTNTCEANNGQQSCHLRVSLRDGRVIDMTTNSEEHDVESVVARVQAFLRRCQADVAAAPASAPQSATVGVVG